MQWRSAWKSNKSNTPPLCQPYVPLRIIHFRKSKSDCYNNHQTHSHTVGFCLIGLLFRVKLVPKSKLSQTFTGQIPFLPHNQQHRSTEGWQCSRLRRTHCHDAVMTGQEHCDGCIDCLVLWLQWSRTLVTITVFLTWRQHAATMLSRSARTVVAVLPFLSPNQSVKAWDTEELFQLTSILINNQQP